MVAFAGCVGDRGSDASFLRRSISSMTDIVDKEQRSCSVMGRVLKGAGKAASSAVDIIAVLLPLHFPPPSSVTL